MSYWIGSYIEAGMGASGSSGTPYLPFVFQAPDKATAQKNAGAKLMAGPFSTESAANAWVTSYERNPNTLHAGSGLSPSTGTVKGDTPPSAADPLAAIANFLTGIGSHNFAVRSAKVLIGGTLLLVGLAKMTGANDAVGKVARLGVWE